MISALYNDLFALIRVVSGRFLSVGLDVRQVPFDLVTGGGDARFQFRKSGELNFDYFQFLAHRPPHVTAKGGPILDSEVASQRFKRLAFVNSSYGLDAAVMACIQEVDRVLARDITYEISEFSSGFSLLVIQLQADFGDKNVSENQLRRCLSVLLHRLLGQVEFRGAVSNNHLLNNLRGIALLAVALGEYDVASEACNKYFFWLEHFLDNDGWLAEGSSSYHVTVCLWTAQVLSFLTRVEGSTQLVLLKRMLVHIPVFRYGRGRIIFMGDICPDRATEGLLAELDHWMQVLGIEDGSRSSPSTSSSSEYRFTEKGGWSAILSCCTNARGARQHHGHDDNGHVSVLRNGCPIVIDPGRANYRRESETQFGQRSREGHNFLGGWFQNITRLKRHGYFKFSCLQGKVSGVTPASGKMHFKWLFWGGWLCASERKIIVDQGLTVQDFYSGLDVFYKKKLILVFAPGIKIENTQRGFTLVQNGKAICELVVGGDVDSISILSAKESSDYGFSTDVEALSVICKRKYRVNVSWSLS